MENDKVDKNQLNNNTDEDLKDRLLSYIKNKGTHLDETKAIVFSEVFDEDIDENCIINYLMDKQNTMITLQDGTIFGIIYMYPQHELRFIKQK